MNRIKLILPMGLCLISLTGCGAIIGEESLQKSVSVEKAAIQQEKRSAIQGGVASVQDNKFLNGNNVDVVKKGTGVLVNPKALTKKPKVFKDGGKLSLNFEKTDIKDVVNTILGDLLKVNYTIDQSISGSVSITTNQMVPEEALLPALEMLLEMNGAVLLVDNGYFRVIPEVRAKSEAVLPTYGRKVPNRSAGKMVHIVPLRYIAAPEMKDILGAFVKSDAILRVDLNRNLLTVAGSKTSVQRILDLVQLFDVNQFAGASTGVFAVENVDVKTIVSELDIIFEQELSSSVKGIVKIIPLERVNSVLVISQQVEYIDIIHKWIKDLDKGVDQIGRKLYVYQVQNGLAIQLSELLSALLDGGDNGAFNVAGTDPKQQKVVLSNTKKSRNSYSKESQGQVKIIADEVNNALLILATSQEYKIVSEALRKIDVMPLQVLVEATIVEVSLTGDLQYGLQWFFNSKGHGVGSSSSGVLGAGKTSALASVFPGFNFSIVDSANSVRALLNMLASESKLNVISSPSIMVLNNQQAEIVVGDQVPVVTRQSVDSGDNDAILVNEVQFRDTGIQLTVTPRVNSGGLVTMAVSQEVSDAVRTTTSGLDTPTIQQRKINSSVAVQNGQTIVLGGLIRENKTETESGVPVLYKVPFVGSLFGQTVENSSRTELLILITPRVISNQDEVKDVTEELRKKLKWLDLR